MVVWQTSPTHILLQFTAHLNIDSLKTHISKRLNLLIFFNRTLSGLYYRFPHKAISCFSCLMTLLNKSKCNHGPLGSNLPVTEL